MTNPQLFIEGGQPLRGSVRVGGSKNAADYALAACLLTGDEVTLDNVPEIEDVRLMTEILASLGAEVHYDGAGVWRIKAEHINRFDAPREMVINQRASFLVMGPLLARFGQAACCSPGGDVIGSRPLDVHLDGFRALGATVEPSGENWSAHTQNFGRLTSARIFLDYPSVTGTMNLVFAAVLADGKTTLINAAAEPEIGAVIQMLRDMGANIARTGTGFIEITGVKELHGTRHTIVPDRLETGLFALAAAATRGNVTIEQTAPDFLDGLISKMREAGVKVEDGPGTLHVSGEGCTYKAVQAQALPYPGLATDLQPPLAAFLTQCQGVSMIYERVYENRLLYIGELRKMGADVITAGQTALITGPTQMRGTAVRALDVRAGGSLVIAALVATGRTEINDLWHLDRAHQDLVAKLTGLGAKVDRPA